MSPSDPRRTAVALVGAFTCTWLAARRGGATLADLPGAIVAATLAAVMLRNGRVLAAVDWPAAALVLVVTMVLVVTGWPGTAAALAEAPERLAHLRWRLGCSIAGVRAAIARFRSPRR